MAFQTESVLERRRFTIEEYWRMGEAGILDEDERVELIEGEIVTMTPIGPPHASVVARLTRLFSELVGRRAFVWVQGPLVLRGQRSQLQPDLSLVQLRADFYRSGHPEPADVFLVVEVMDSSVERDQRVKIPIYARAGIPEVWLVNLNTDSIETHRRPAPAGYRERRVIEHSGSLGPQAFPDLVIPAADIVGRIG